MIEINLVPDVKQELIKAQRIRASVISIAILVSVAAVIGVVVLALLIGAQALTNKLADDSIASESKTLAQKPDLANMLTIQQQLTKLSDLHAAQQLDSRLFDILAAVNPPSPNNVRISNVKLDPTTSTLTIEGNATNGYGAVETFKKTLLSAQLQYTAADGSNASIPMTNDVAIQDTNYSEDASGQKILRFTLSFVYPAEALARTSQNAKFVTPTTQQNVTDSQNRVPESLFTTAATDAVKGGR